MAKMNDPWRAVHAMAWPEAWGIEDCTGEMVVAPFMDEKTAKQIVNAINEHARGATE